jgi:amylosucrase
MTFDKTVHDNTTRILQDLGIQTTGADNAFYVRVMSEIDNLHHLYKEVYQNHPKESELFHAIIQTIAKAYLNREKDLKKRDEEKLDKGKWFLSNELMGMSLYVDRFCGSLPQLPSKLNYLEDLGISTSHALV